jgi:hypothetical protein
MRMGMLRVTDRWRATDGILFLSLRGCFFLSTNAEELF